MINWDNLSLRFEAKLQRLKKGKADPTANKNKQICGTISSSLSFRRELKLLVLKMEDCSINKNLLFLTQVIIH